MAVGSGLEELAAALDSASRSDERLVRGRRSRGRDLGVALVLGGSGGWAGMGASLLEQELAFLEVVEACDRALRDRLGASVLDAMAFGEWPDGGGEAAGGEALGRALLFAVQAGALALWRRWGVTADVLAGEGVGLLAAAHAAGAMELPEAARLAAAGAVPADLPEGTVPVVRPSDAVDGVTCELVVEVGPPPGSAVACAADGALAVPSLRAGEDERRTMLEALGALHVSGRDVRWDALHPAGARVVPLPRYPWRRTRVWLADAPAPGAAAAVQDGAAPAATGSAAADAAAPAATGSAAADAAVPPGGAAPAADSAGSATPAPPDPAPAAPPPPDVRDWLVAEAARILRLDPDRLEVDLPIASLGLDSLMAVELQEAIERTFERSLDVSALVEGGTLADVAALVEHAVAHPEEAGPSRAAPAVVPALDERHEPFPLTDVQHAYWVGRSSAYELGGVSCHLYLELESDALDPERLTDALNRLIARHDML
ncbi:MAG TPA: phosphopantetheine-binding protein, partial [Thermoleophilaceae bacterium]